VPDPRDAPPLRWGILGPGIIARTFVSTLAKNSRQQVVAAGSRDADRAARFAAEHGIPRHHGSYQALVDDPEVDVVYVSSPHSYHHEHALLAIRAGKHVLVEKPLTRNAAEARAVADAARSAGVVALEAMWSRFLPGIDVLRQLLADGALGQIVSVRADHGQVIGPETADRLHNPHLAGGALLDLGTYPVSFAQLVLGQPDEISATGRLTDTGVDAAVRAVLRCNGAEAVVTTTLAAQTENSASIVGTLARVDLPGDFFTPVPVTVTSSQNGAVRTADPGPIHGHEGLAYQAAHLAQLVADGARESPLLPLDDTIGVLTTCDEIRRQLGVVYPGE
jgi:predicted dehydrogenase